jgi:acyl carrier protein
MEFKQNEVCDRNYIQKQVYIIANHFLEENCEWAADRDRLLHIILSESSQALEFVCSLEDEFDIEFEDDEIDIDFFSSFNTITARIINKITKK